MNCPHFLVQVYHAYLTFWGHFAALLLMCLFAWQALRLRRLKFLAVLAADAIRRFLFLACIFIVWDGAFLFK